MSSSTRLSKSIKIGRFFPNQPIFGPSGEIRTPGVLNPNQVPYQLGHTRILDCEKMLVVVKYVVKGILPHFQETFKSGYWGSLRRTRGVCNISGSRTGLVLRLPNHALYHLSYTRLFHSSGGAYSLDTRLPPDSGENCRTRRPSSRGVGLYRKKRLSLYTLPGKKARKRIISSLRN